MGIFDIPLRCKENPFFEKWYYCFCDETGINDAMGLSDEEWSDEFERYVEKREKEEQTLNLGANPEGES